MYIHLLSRCMSSSVIYVVLFFSLALPARHHALNCLCFTYGCYTHVLELDSCDMIVCMYESRRCLSIYLLQFIYLCAYVYESQTKLLIDVVVSCSDSGVIVSCTIIITIIVIIIIIIILPLPHHHHHFHSHLHSLSSSSSSSIILILMYSRFEVMIEQVDAARLMYV